MRAGRVASWFATTEAPSGSDVPQAAPTRAANSGRDLVVGPPRHPAVAEDRAPGVLAVNQAAVDGHAFIHELARPDADAGAHAGVAGECGGVTHHRALTDGHARAEQALATDDAAVQLRVGADVGVTLDDALADLRPLLHDGVVPDHGRAAEHGVAVHLAAASDVHRADHARSGVHPPRLGRSTELRP